MTNPVNTKHQVDLVVSAGLVELAAHIVISEGRVLGLRVYSILPGSKSKQNMKLL